MKKLIYLFVVICSIHLAQAQNGSIRGQVLDNEGQFLEFANVLLLSVQDSSLVKGGLSEMEGKYEFNDLSDGEYLIKATMVGYGEGYSTILNISGLQSLDVEPIMLADGIEIEEIAVVAKKPLIELKADKMVVNVANSSISAGNSALEILEKSPGVALDNNNNVSLKGRQGVLITVNGKNQYLSGDEISRMLENMPASNIKSIEIIDNPSAKHDAEGNGGIINIVLKKNEKLGFNGNLSTSLRQGWNTTQNHSLNLNYRGEKLNVYGGLDYYNWGWTQNLYLNRTINYETKTTMFDQLSVSNKRGIGYDVKIGIDYSITPATMVSLLMKQNDGKTKIISDNETEIEGENKPVFDVLNVVSESLENYKTTTYNGNISHQFNDAGMKIEWDTDLSSYNNGEEGMYESAFMDRNMNEVVSPNYLRNNSSVDIDILASKLDFTLPISDRLNLEMGGKLSMVNTKNTTVFEDKEENGSWENVVDRSNDFNYTEDVTAAYVNASSKIGEYSIQGGLRMEHTKSLGNSITLDKRVERSYTNFFPSLSVSRMINKKHNLSATYSRRLERPGYKKLNPFIYFLDQYTFNRGNPFLRPQYTDAFGLNYGFGNALFVAANYSHTKDAITQVIEQDSKNNVNYQTNENLDDFRNFSLTVSAPKVWTEWFVTRMNYTAYYTDYRSQIQSGTIDRNHLSHMVNISNEIQLPYGVSMEVSGNYQSKIVYGILDIGPQSSINVGLSKRVLNGKGTVKINAADLMLRNNSTITIDQNDINLFGKERNDSRRVTFSFSYRFGNDKVKEARKRRTAASEESGRI